MLNRWLTHVETAKVFLGAPYILANFNEENNNYTSRPVQIRQK